MNTPRRRDPATLPLDAADAAERPVTVHGVMLSGHDSGTVRCALEQIGAELTLAFELTDHGGEILLVDAEFAACVAPQFMLAVAAGRPVVTLAEPDAAGDAVASHDERFERQRRDLARQLQALPAVQRRRLRAAGRADPAPVELDATGAPSGGANSGFGPGSDGGFDSGFNSQLDADPIDSGGHLAAQQRLLEALGQRAFDPAAPALTASYGDGASLRLDFRARLATVDRLAQPHLRSQRELPVWIPSVRPLPHFSVRALDLTLWDLGMAAGAVRPMGAPPDWWHTPLHSPGSDQVRRYSGVPRHLEMVRHLRAAAVTPSELRRRARVSVAELRSFLQACLLLRLSHW